jgi:hypothetical protein
MGRELHQYAMLNWYKHLKACDRNMNEPLEQELCKFLSSTASLKWLVATLVTMKSRQGNRVDIRPRRGRHRLSLELDAR